MLVNYLGSFLSASVMVICNICASAVLFGWLPWKLNFDVTDSFGMQLDFYLELFSSLDCMLFYMIFFSKM